MSDGGDVAPCRAVQTEPATTTGDREAGLHWRRFPTGRARIVANRWLDRRRALLFVAWFGLVLLPALAAISWGARVGGVVGLLILMVTVVLAFFGTVSPMGMIGARRAVINWANAIDGHTLLTKYGTKPPMRHDLHAGIVSVLEPGWRHGRAHTLAVDTSPKRRAVPWLLLSNPATGEFRDARDLRRLADVLCASPVERDRAAGRVVLSLSSQAAVAAGDLATAQWEPEDLPPSVWSALKSFGRTLALLLALLVMVMFGGDIEVWRQTGAGDAVANAAVYLIMLTAVALGVYWLMYFLYRLVSLVTVTVRAAAGRLRR